MIALEVTKWSQHSDLCPTVTKRLQLAVIRRLISALLDSSSGTKCRFPRDVLKGWQGLDSSRGEFMVSKNYLTRQATTLVKFAQSTSDPRRWTALVEKATEFKSQADEARPRSDLSPRAPDVEPTLNQLKPTH
jgi:hypothetical protein